MGDMKPPYRILHVIDHLGTGGAQEVVCQLVKYSQCKLFQPEVLTLRGFGHYWEVLRKAGVPVHSLFPYELETFKYYGCLEAHMFSRLFLFLTRTRYDVLHSHLLWSIMMATPMGALCRVPVRLNHEQVYDVVRHFSGNEVILGNRRRRHLSNRLCHHIIAGSNSIRNFAYEVEKVPTGKVSLIYNGVDLEQLRPVKVAGEREKWRRTWGIPKDSLVVGGIGRLDPQKNFPMFLEVAAKVSVRFPQAMFVIAGDGKDRESLEDLSRKLGIGEKVIFLGFVKELPELYLVMDLLLFPSLFEGTPLTIFGALAMGLPVVASRVDGIAETLRDERDALLVSPEDKELFVHQVCQLLQNRELAQEIAQTGQQTVRRYYSAEVMVKQVEALYLKLLEEKRERT
jgi:glycosyltransferase involved in cell wall biosynthesis